VSIRFHQPVASRRHGPVVRINGAETRWPSLDHRPTVSPVWSDTDLADFARDGYLVAAGVVSQPLREQALARIDQLLAADPVPAGYTGHHFVFQPTADEPALTALLRDSGALDLAQTLTAPRPIAVPPQVQVAWTFPPHPHQPTAGHLDGFSVTEPDGRPGTFTLLAGVVLSEQTHPGMGNLIVWPGSHRACATLIREHGVAGLLANGGHPTVAHNNPTPVCAASGDVVFCSYLLSHNTGPNTSDLVRTAVYFRLKVEGYDSHWQAATRDELYEFPPARHTVR
jgi:hypothetical protein